MSDLELPERIIGIPTGALRTTMVTSIAAGGTALGAGIAALIKGAGVETPVDAAVADGFLFVVAVALLAAALVISADAKARAAVFAPIAGGTQHAHLDGLRSSQALPVQPVPTALTTLAVPLTVRVPGDARTWTAIAAGSSADGALLLLSCPGEAPSWRRTLDLVAVEAPPPDRAPDPGAVRLPA